MLWTIPDYSVACITHYIYIIYIYFLFVDPGTWQQVTIDYGSCNTLFSLLILILFMRLRYFRHKQDMLRRSLYMYGVMLTELTLIGEKRLKEIVKVILVLFNR